MSFPSENAFDQGVNLLEQEQYAEASEAFQTWLSSSPDDLDALHNLGVAEFYNHDLESALRAWKRALQLAPHNLALQSTILEAADELQRKRLPVHASYFFELLLKSERHGLTAVLRLGWCLRYSNHTERALKLLQQALQKYPDNLALKLQEVFLLPLVYASEADMDAWHAHLLKGLEALEPWLQEQKNLNSESVYLYSPIFDLMAQGRNEREVLQRISRIWRRIFVPKAEWPSEPPPKRARLRLGIVSGTVYDHSTMHYFRGLFEQLAEENDIETGLFYFGYKQDAYTRHMSSLVSHFLQLPMDMTVGVEAIGNWQPDVLFYLDIGMESLLYTLAHLRLAPVQCVSAGVPMTTGIDTMDYYISSRWFEPENAQQYYSEKLISLDQLMVNMYPPAQNNPLKTRSELGLPEDRHLYFFPHTLIRLDPELDDIFAQIIARDPLADIYLMQDPSNGLHHHILQRFERQYPEAVAHLHFLPWMPQKDFLNVLACANVALDSLRLGGGNVTFQSFYVGTPMIQCPTPLLRCRIASGLYRLLDLPEWIAQDWDDYLEKALQLGTQASLRQELSERLLAGRERIFKHREGVAAMFDCFREWGGFPRKGVSA